MEGTTFNISGGFSKTQLEEIRSGAIRVLNKVGMKVSHERLLAMLSVSEGVSVEEQRVRFSSDLCERYLDRFRTEQQDAPRCEDYRLEGPWYPSNILEAETGRIRPGTCEDVRRLIRLCSAMGVTRLIPPLAPKDVPAEIEVMTSWKLALENSSDFFGGPLTSVEDVECALKMASVVGIKGPIWCAEVTISPLTINPHAMDLILAFLDRDCLVQGEPGPMISAGCSGPVFSPAFFIQAVAEWLGAYIILKVISQGRLGNAQRFRTLFNGGLRFEPMHFDMRNGAVAFGTPESLLFRLAARQIFRFLGGSPELGGAFRTCSKQLDAQCIAQRAMNVLTEALDGVRVFVAAGMMANDDVVCPELLIIDAEILDYVRRVTGGLDYLADHEASLRTIEEIGPGGNYLSHETTMKHYRRAYSFPKIFDYRTLMQWNTAKGPTLLERARTIIEEKLAAYEFRLDEDKQRALDEIYTTYVKSKGAQPDAARAV